MKKLKLCVCFVFLSMNVFSQSYVTLYYDTKHYQAVTENQLMRMSSEAILENQSKKIEDNIDKINRNYAKLVVVKHLIYNSLYEINEIIKDGREVKYIGNLILDIKNEADLLTKYSKDNPKYTIFATNYGVQLYTTSLSLFNNVKTLVLTKNKDLLMNYNTRDELLREVVVKLQFLRAELYGARQAMYWTKINGIWNSLNPFKDIINQDKSIINSIIIKSKEF
jgi:hypothetical protein